MIRWFSAICILASTDAQAALSLKAIAAGGNRSLAVASDGTVWEWTDTWSKATRVSGLTGITAVAAGMDHTLALKDDRTVWGWGSNSMGQLGDGTTTNRTTPVQVGGLTGVTAISAGSGDSLALKSDGTVWGWGATGAYYSQRLTPTQVTGLTRVVGVVASNGYDVAVKLDGTVWGWTVRSWSAPSQVSGLAGVVAVAGSGGYGLALKADGTVWEWRIPDPQQTQYAAAPVQVEGLTGVMSLTSWSVWGWGGHRLALKRDGTVWAWGNNWYGQLGDGTTGEGGSRPVQVSGLTGVVAVAAGNTHGLALKSDGTLWGWGGIGFNSWRTTPAKISGISGVAAAFAGGSRSLALKDDGTLWQWGGPDITGRAGPTQVSKLDDVVSLATNGYQSVALKRDGKVWAWGLSPTPRTEQEQPAPVEMEGLDGVVAVAASNGSTVVAAKADGTTWEWTGYPLTWIEGPRIDGVVAVATLSFEGWFDSSRYNVALKGDGTVWSWPLLYNGGWIPSEPLKVSGLAGVLAIACGDICMALKRDGTVWEWSGRTSPGQRGGLSGVVAIAVGGGHSLALKGDGTVWAWGDNSFGQLGIGATGPRDEPVQVAGLSGVTATAAGGRHSLAVKRDGTILAWGDGGQGQLADERSAPRTRPVQFAVPGSPDLAIEMSHSGDFSVGGKAIYTLTITNTGLTPTSGEVTVIDTLPPGLTYTSTAGSGWSCSAARETVTCKNPGPVEPGASSTITLTADVGPSAYPGVTNLAAVSNPSDLNDANDTAGDPAVVLPGR